MFSLYLSCRAEDKDELSCALWVAGTAGIREEDTALIAGFEDDADRAELSAQFSSYAPRWEREADTNWEAKMREAWPGREVGQHLFLAPVWHGGETPASRVRVIHNPGMASGTGEHPCTQLALESIETCVFAGCVFVDIGTGSGILAIAALQLKARVAAAVDMDVASLATATENFTLNGYAATVVAGSADCISSSAADVVVANISGTVLIDIADELLRIVKPGGCLILTGYPDSELAVIQGMFGNGEVSSLNEWRCLTLRAQLPQGRLQALAAGQHWSEDVP